ncbi:MAG: asparaginase [Bacillota bacterium]
MSTVIANVTRGPIVECIHRGDIAVVDPEGRLVAHAGDPDKVTYMRSSAKPIQALNVVLTGAADHFGLDDQELAITCASHDAEDQHVNTVRSVLTKLGLDESALLCGVHAPVNAAAARALVVAGKKPGPVHNNCSGKHSGMLAVARQLGAPLDNYLALDHPVQQMNLAVVAEFAGVDPTSVIVGVDGCGVPVFGLPMRAMARAFARLAAPEVLRPELAAAARRVVVAMQKNPTLIEGTGRFTSRLIEVGAGRLVAKSGAEGVFCAGSLQKKLGLAVKGEDGSLRPLPPVVLKALSELGAVGPDDLAALAKFTRPVVKNNRGDRVGEVIAVAELRRD